MSGSTMNSPCAKRGRKPTLMQSSSRCWMQETHHGLSRLCFSGRRKCGGRASLRLKSDEIGATDRFMRSPSFVAEAHRQSLAVAKGPHAKEDQGFIDAVSYSSGKRSAARFGHSDR